MEWIESTIGGKDCQYRERKLWQLWKDAPMEISIKWLVVPVFWSCLTVDRSTRQGDVISIPSSVLDRYVRMINNDLYELTVITVN